MRNKFVRGVCKIVSFIIVFCIIFAVLQNVIPPKYYGERINSFYNLENNSIDVLFLGGSQMFCTVDAQKLTDEYEISSYDFGASAQRLAITYYYLQEALKYQHPKVVMVEMGAFFFESEFDEQTLAWNYVPTPLTIEKYYSLKNILGGDRLKAIKYCLPLLVYHSNWGSLWFYEEHSERIRGFLGYDTTKEVTMVQDDGEVYEPTQDTVDALTDIVQLCGENNIEIVFFKSPVTDWTGTQLKVVKEFMAENHFEYLDCNDYFDEIGINLKTDFFDEHHLNVTGADKTTDLIADYLKKLLGQQENDDPPTAP